MLTVRKGYNSTPISTGSPGAMTPRGDGISQVPMELCPSIPHMPTTLCALLPNANGTSCIPNGIQNESKKARLSVD
jgi:hypothetical protein